MTAGWDGPEDGRKVRWGHAHECVAAPASSAHRLLSICLLRHAFAVPALSSVGQLQKRHITHSPTVSHPPHNRSAVTTLHYNALHLPATHCIISNHFPIISPQCNQAINITIFQQVSDQPNDDPPRQYIMVRPRQTVRTRGYIGSENKGSETRLIVSMESPLHSESLPALNPMAWT